MSKLIGSAGTLGENIRRIRIQCGLTQEQTVARLQTMGSPLSRSTYSIVEMGKGNLYVSDLVGLQQVFGVPYDEFFRDISPARRPNEQRRSNK